MTTPTTYNVSDIGGSSTANGSTAHRKGHR